MKVLLQNRSSYLHSVAGDTVQLLKTHEHLLHCGIDATISSRPDQNLSGYDLVHFFNLMPVEETYQFYLNARKQGKKIVLSPIFWDPVEFLEESREGLKFGEWWRQTMPMRAEILSGVKMILPNSRMEEVALHKYFSTLPASMIVPNAADKIFAEARPERFIQRYQPPREFILSVGRICRRKNQLLLIQAVRVIKKPLICIGPLNDTSYYQECRREAAGASVKFIDVLQPVDLASAYATAKVHALVSWYDTPGLVSLEAGLAGCQVVSTDRGSTREYLGDLAFYCEPDKRESIVQALRMAWSASRNNRLKERILNHYTWDIAATATLQAYRKVLEN